MSRVLVTRLDVMAYMSESATDGTQMYDRGMVWFLSRGIFESGVSDYAELILQEFIVGPECEGRRSRFFESLWNVRVDLQRAIDCPADERDDALRSWFSAHGASEYPELAGALRRLGGTGAKYPLIVQ